MVHKHLTITAVSRLAEVHPSSARNYVNSGDLVPERTSSGIRLFDEADAVRLRALVAEGRARRGRPRGAE